MAVFRQLILGLAVLAAVTFVWIKYVPESLPLLERAGVLDVLGIEYAPPQQGEASQRRRGPSGPTQVIVSRVEARVQADEVTAIGDGRALRSVSVRSEAVGKITDMDLVAGDVVDAGQVIVRLDEEAETIALERARLTLDDAKSDAQRIKTLRQTGAVTEVRAREADLALRTAELNLRQAEFDLSQRRIIAPIAGRVGIPDVEVGDRIAAQQALVSITDRSQILIDFRVPERVISDISIGMPVSVMPLGLRDLNLEGRLSAIDTVVDRASRTLRVQARLDNSDDLLRVGMAFRVSLTFPGDPVLAVDPLSLQWSSDGSFVWAVRDGMATRVNVRIVQRNASEVLVEADLAPGETIVTEGVQALRPGSEVSIREESSGLSVALPTKNL